MDEMRSTVIWRTMFSVVCAVSLMSTYALAQTADCAVPLSRESATTENAAGEEGGAQTQAALEDENVQGPSYGVPVIERNFEAGTVILSAQHLFGDWFGRRPEWEESGFKPSATWLTNLAGNPVGGREPGFTECENLGVDLLFDLEKSCDVCDTTFHVSMSQRSGTSLTNDYVGNTFSTQQVFGGETFKLAHVELQRYFCDRQADVKLGRIAANDDFMVSPYFW